MWRIAFDEIEVRFRSGNALLIYKDRTELIEDETTNKSKDLPFKSIGFGDDQALYRLSPDVILSAVRSFERHAPIDHVGQDRWYDYNLERTLTTIELIERYADQLPRTLDKSSKVPDSLQRALASVDAHLVETQRLLYLEESEERSPHRRREQVIPPSVVEKDAAHLAEHIGRLLQQYANESQKLDQTFPKRVLAFQSGTASTEEEIRAHLHKLTQKRDDLMSVGLLGSAISEAIQPSDIFKEESIRRILSIYVEDTSAKLSIFDNTYAKIRLFKQILDEQLLL